MKTNLVRKSEGTRARPGENDQTGCYCWWCFFFFIFGCCCYWVATELLMPAVFDGKRNVNDIFGDCRRKRRYWPTASALCVVLSVVRLDNWSAMNSAEHRSVLGRTVERHYPAEGAERLDGYDEADKCVRKRLPAVSCRICPIWINQ